MRLRLLGTSSGKNGCPALCATDRGTYVVQGKLITDAEAIASLVDVREDEFYVGLGFEHTAFRLETRERYVDDEEQGPLRRFLAGEPPDDEWFMDWYDAVVRFAEAGKRMERVRVVSEPPSEYTRFGIDLARLLNVPAGEDIRYLPRRRAEALGLPDEDFWLLDSSRVLTLRFDGDVLLGAELITDPAAVVQRAGWRDAAWHYAVRVGEYADA